MGTYPVCLKCKLFYKPHKIGVNFVEGKPVGSHWQPYKLWRSDIYRCRGCGSEILYGSGLQPWALDFEKDFKEKLAASEAVAFVMDC